MNKIVIVLSLFLLLLLISCQTTSELEMYESFEIPTDDSMEIKSAIAIPDVELFISAPIKEEIEDKTIDVSQISIPEEAVPLIVEEEETLLEDEEDINVIIDYLETKKEPEVIPIPVLEDTTIISPSKEPIVEKVTIIPEIVSTEKIDIIELEYNSGEDLLIKLDKEGWIFDNSNSPAIVKLKKREFNNDQTWFLFSISDQGDYILDFYLQNLSTGMEENSRYKIVINNPAVDVSSAIIINPETEDQNLEIFEQSDISLTLEEENIPDLVASFEQLVDEEEPLNSLELFDAFNLLEKQGGYDQYLVELSEFVFKIYPYDNISAELLFKAAQAIEKPGPLQDIDKALGLFKLVRDYFPISVYCDKSEERIRYLERHFMKIY